MSLTSGLVCRTGWIYLLTSSLLMHTAIKSRRRTFARCYWCSSRRSRSFSCSSICPLICCDISLNSFCLFKLEMFSVMEKEHQSESNITAGTCKQWVTDKTAGTFAFWFLVLIGGFFRTAWRAPFMFPLHNDSQGPQRTTKHKHMCKQKEMRMIALQHTLCIFLWSRKFDLNYRSCWGSRGNNLSVYGTIAACVWTSIRPNVFLLHLSL